MSRSSVGGSFFSLSIIDDDISMVIDCRDISRLVCMYVTLPPCVDVNIMFRFPEGSLYHTEGTWKLLRIGEGPLGFGESLTIDY